MEEPILPIGTILPYAGEVVDHLKDDGWLLCNGQSLPVAGHRRLHEAIGTTFGTLEQGSFSAPFLNGLFLRGRQGTSAARTPGGDPDADSRRSHRPGSGASGNAVGSVQQYATARPRNPFTAEISGGKIVSKGVDGGGDNHIARYIGESRNVSADRGGDLESRPKNKYVHFIIKYADHTVDGRLVEAPVGSLMAFAGIADTYWQTNWKLCNGDCLSNRGVFEGLFRVLGFGNGKVDDTQFYLPDYRGFFLRGVNGTGGYDPEAGSRKPPMPQNPDGKRGNGGNAVGSMQDDATGFPMNRFTASYPHLPNGYWNNICSAAGTDVYKWNDAGRRVNLSDGGGDAETRPVNVLVAWYVRFR